MPKLVQVNYQNKGFEIEGLLLHFDEVIPFKTAVDLVAHAYQRRLREKGIDRKVFVYNTTDTPGFRSYGIAVEGQKWRDPLFEVVSGEQDNQIYTFTRYETPRTLTQNEALLFEIDRKGIFSQYLEKELSNVLSE